MSIAPELSLSRTNGMDGPAPIVLGQEKRCGRDSLGPCGPGGRWMKARCTFLPVRSEASMNLRRSRTLAALSLAAALLGLAAFLIPTSGSSSSALETGESPHTLSPNAVRRALDAALIETGKTLPNAEAGLLKFSVSAQQGLPLLPESHLLVVADERVIAEASGRCPELSIVCRRRHSSIEIRCGHYETKIVPVTWEGALADLGSVELRHPDSITLVVENIPVSIERAFASLVVSRPERRGSSVIARGLALHRDSRGEAELQIPIPLAHRLAVYVRGPDLPVQSLATAPCSDGDVIRLRLPKLLTRKFRLTELSTRIRESVALSAELSKPSSNSGGAPLVARRYVDLKPDASGHFAITGSLDERIRIRTGPAPWISGAEGASWASPAGQRVFALMGGLVDLIPTAPLIGLRVTAFGQAVPAFAVYAGDRRVWAGRSQAGIAILDRARLGRADSLRVMTARELRGRGTLVSVGSEDLDVCLTQGDCVLQVKIAGHLPEDSDLILSGPSQGSGLGKPFQIFGVDLPHIQRARASHLTTFLNVQPGVHSVHLQAGSTTHLLRTGVTVQPGENRIAIEAPASAAVTAIVTNYDEFRSALPHLPRLSFSITDLGLSLFFDEDGRTRAQLIGAPPIRGRVAFSMPSRQSSGLHWANFDLDRDAGQLEIELELPEFVRGYCHAQLGGRRTMELPNGRWVQIESDDSYLLPVPGGTKRQAALSTMWERSPAAAGKIFRGWVLADEAPEGFEGRWFDIIGLGERCVTLVAKRRGVKSVRLGLLPSGTRAVWIPDQVQALTLRIEGGTRLSVESEMLERGLIDLSSH